LPSYHLTSKLFDVVLFYASNQILSICFRSKGVRLEIFPFEYITIRLKQGLYYQWYSHRIYIAGRSDNLVKVSFILDEIVHIIEDKGIIQA